MGSGKLLLVGGYGHVGTVLARELAIRHPGQVIIAGRRGEEAEALAATLGLGTEAVRVDVRDEAGSAGSDNVLTATCISRVA